MIAQHSSQDLILLFDLLCRPRIVKSISLYALGTENYIVVIVYGSCKWMSGISCIVYEYHVRYSQIGIVFLSAYFDTVSRDVLPQFRIYNVYCSCVERHNYLDSEFY
jgi:hypothetical protein